MIRQGQREAEITRAVCGQHFWPPNAEVRIELSPSARTAAAACGTTTCRIFVRNNCGRLVTTLGQPAFYGQHSKATRSSLIFIVSCSISLIALASFNAPYAIHFPPPPPRFLRNVPCVNRRHIKCSYGFPLIRAWYNSLFRVRNRWKFENGTGARDNVSFLFTQIYE